MWRRQNIARRRLIFSEKSQHTVYFQPWFQNEMILHKRKRQFIQVQWTWRTAAAVWWNYSQIYNVHCMAQRFYNSIGKKEEDCDAPKSENEHELPRPTIIPRQLWHFPHYLTQFSLSLLLLLARRSHKKWFFFLLLKLAQCALTLTFLLAAAPNPLSLSLATLLRSSQLLAM